MERSTRQRQAAGKDRYLVMRLDAVRRVFGSDAQIARALGVDPAQVSRWRQGQDPDTLNRDRLTALDGVVEMLVGSLTPGRTRKWLEGPNLNLGDRTPIEALRQGDVPGVLAAVQVLKSGAHA